MRHVDFRLDVWSKMACMPWELGEENTKTHDRIRIDHGGMQRSTLFRLEAVLIRQGELRIDTSSPKAS